MSTSEHRRRAVAAVAQVVAERGYREARVADVLERAGMSRRTFYEQFSSLEDYFLEAYEAVREETLSRLDVPPAPTAEQWSEHVEEALRALLEYAAEQPELARLLVVEPPAAGQPGLQRHEETMRTLAERLARAHPEPGGDTPLRFEAGVGAVHRIIHSRLVDGRAHELPELAPELTALVDRLARE